MEKLFFNVNSNTHENGIYHNDIIVTQFTKPAIPFSQMAQHSNHYGLELMFELSDSQIDSKALISGKIKLFISHNWAIT